MVPVRDGTRIAVRIYRPEGAGPFPTLFGPSPYRYDNNQVPPYPLFLWRETGPIEWYVEQGYAYVHADVRGTGMSEGEFDMLSCREQQDLYDLIEWIGTRSWSNGKVGGIGQSYFCMSQWFMGIQNPPHLACLGAYDGMNDMYRHMAYPGGIEGTFPSYWFSASVRVSNLFPANGNHPRHVEPDLFLQIQKHPLYDEYWRERTAAERLQEIKVPVFSIGVWAKADLHLEGNILGYQKARGPKKLAITGTPTAFSSMLDFADIEFHRRYLLPFYDRYLKGIQNGFENRPNVEYVVKNTGVVRSFEAWPPSPTRLAKFYLSGAHSGTVKSLNDGGLETAAPAQGGSTTYSYRGAGGPAGPGSGARGADLHQPTPGRRHGNGRHGEAHAVCLLDPQRHGFRSQSFRAVGRAAGQGRAAALHHRDQGQPAGVAHGCGSGAQLRRHAVLHAHPGNAADAGQDL
jgi:putative CocE/NonD family hydrolase